MIDIFRTRLRDLGGVVRGERCPVPGDLRGVALFLRHRGAYKIAKQIVLRLGQDRVGEGECGRCLSHAEVEATALEVRDTLTPREIEIVRMVAQGLRNKSIAERLTIAEGTVKVHLHNIYEKLGVDGRLELVLRAQQMGLS